VRVSSGTPAFFRLHGDAEQTAGPDEIHLAPSLGDRPIMEEVPEFTVHVPFDGDPDVFGIAPSICSVSHASGKIVGQELLLKFLMVMPGFELQGSIDRTLGQINSTLRKARHLRPAKPEESLSAAGRSRDIGRAGTISCAHDILISDSCDPP
jgi:hypothetical protein